MTKESVGSVAWIGLGKMGRPMSSRLLAAHWRLQVFSRSLETGDPLVRAGAQRYESAAAAIEGVAVICLTLPNDDAVRAIAGEIAPSVRSGQLVVDFGTTSPKLTRQLSELLRGRGADLVDAPVSGGPQGAANGTLSIMVGAAENEHDLLPKLFAVLGKPTWFGRRGDGQLAKLCNQILVACNIASVTEAILLGAAHDLPLDRLLAALGAGAAASWVLEHKGPMIASEDWETQGRAVTQLKDLNLVAEAASAVALQLPLAEDTRAWFQKLVMAGFGDRDHSALRLVPPPSATND